MTRKDTDYKSFVHDGYLVSTKISPAGEAAAIIEATVRKQPETVSGFLVVASCTTPDFHAIVLMVDTGIRPVVNFQIGSFPYTQATDTMRAQWYDDFRTFRSQVEGRLADLAPILQTMLENYKAGK